MAQIAILIDDKTVDLLGLVYSLDGQYVDTGVAYNDQKSLLQ